MDFKFSEEHLMIQQAARDFAESELLPGVIERDNEQRFPTEEIKKLGELGMMGMMEVVWIPLVMCLRWKKFLK
jgi:alkylation response protein AidB-like acyl-CoA dehydrogenase